MSANTGIDYKYWLGFNRVQGIGPAKLRAILDYFGNLRDAWNASIWQLQQIGIDRRAIESFVNTRSNIDLELEIKRVHQAGISLISWNSPEYPRYLQEIANPPPLLYMQGQFSPVDQWAVAVVGTRRMTAYGRQVTQDLVRGLVRSNVTIVSGLARGVDAIAHRTALESNGRTIAVLGSGLDHIYPAENQALALRMAEGQGAVLTEYALGVRPEAGNFPPRNRVISGLSMGVIVIEAGERSGALITAKFALEQDREVFAVPGNIKSPSSKGTNRLIQEGAKLITRVEDVLEELNLMMVPEQAGMQLVMPESAEEALLLAQLSHEPRHIDELSLQAGLPSSLVSSTLTLMELKGMVLQVGGLNYVLSREPDPEYKLGSIME